MEQHWLDLSHNKNGFGVVPFAIPRILHHMIQASRLLLAFFLLAWAHPTDASPKVVHVFVALCDNANQGIVPVPAQLGNGQDARTNLYWGALYGLKTHFRKQDHWTLIQSSRPSNPNILERCIFKHSSGELLVVADAYDGREIGSCMRDFLKASSGHAVQNLAVDGASIEAGGGAQLLAYIGHNGLMELELENNWEPANSKERQSIMLACISKSYFSPHLKKTGAEPLLWSTGLMAPEAYTLDAAIIAWHRQQSNEVVRLRAAEAYHQYQKCGLNAAKNLLVTGW